MDKYVKDLLDVSKALNGRIPNKKEYEILGRYKLSIEEFRICYNNAFLEKQEKPKERKPKILVLDIETSYMEVKSWRTGDQTIRHGQILKDWCILAFCAKWLEEKTEVYNKSRKPKLIYMDMRARKSDAPLMRKLWKILDSADMVITKNGKRFDIPKINARFLLNGIEDAPSEYAHRDVEQMSRSKFAFSSHSLDYLSQNLNKRYKKLDHDAFPGEKLWDECLAGNMKAWDAMREYNVHDVLATEELYHILLPYGAPHNVQSFTNSTSFGCPNGHSDYKRNGVRRNPNTGTQTQRYQCKVCHTLFSDKQDLRSDTQKRNFKGPL